MAEPVEVAVAATAGAPTVVILATEDAWIRVRDERQVIFEGTLPAGGRFAVPEAMTEPLLRAGNSKSVYVLVDGLAYGPIGSSSRLVKNILLRPAEIESRFPRADGALDLTQ